MEIKELYEERKNIRKLISDEKWKITDAKRHLHLLRYTEQKLSLKITQKEIDLFNKQNEEKKEK